MRTNGIIRKSLGKDESQWDARCRITKLIQDDVILNLQMCATMLLGDCYRYYQSFEGKFVLEVVESKEDWVKIEKGEKGAYITDSFTDELTLLQKAIEIGFSTWPCKTASL